MLSLNILLPVEGLLVSQSLVETHRISSKFTVFFSLQCLSSSIDLCSNEGHSNSTADVAAWSHAYLLVIRQPCTINTTLPRCSSQGPPTLVHLLTTTSHQLSADLNPLSSLYLAACTRQDEESTHFSQA